MSWESDDKADPNIETAIGWGTVDHNENFLQAKANADERGMVDESEGGHKPKGKKSDYRKRMEKLAKTLR